MADCARYILWGSAGHAKVLASLVTLLGGQVVALFDNNPKAVSALLGIPLFIGKQGFLQWSKGETDSHKIFGLAAIGGSRGYDRLLVHELFKTHGIRVEPLIHPSATVCASSSLGAGTQILAQSVISADVLIGNGCIINHNASVDHECVLGNGDHVAPGATLCGCVTLGDNVMIGANAVVLPRISIGAGTIVGAGAVVTHNLPASVIVAGNPARIIRKNPLSKSYQEPLE